REFSRSPSDTLRAYLCWFRVRAPTTLLEDFLGSVESENFGTKIFLPITVQDEDLSGFSYSSSLPAWAHTSIRAHSLSYCVPPIAHSGHEGVRDYQPVVHRLRSSAST